MTKFSLLAAAGLVCINNFASAGNYTFRTWFEMPETVVAGETFDVWLRVSLELNGELVPTGPNVSWMSGMSASLEATEDIFTFDTFSQVLDGLRGRPFRGVSSDTWLRDFAVLQDPDAPIPLNEVDYSNPVRVVFVQVATVAHTRGTLHINLRPSEFFGNEVALQWWDGIADQPISTRLDHDIEVISETGVIRVIPAPASLALLAPLALASTRRRRRG